MMLDSHFYLSSTRGDEITMSKMCEVVPGRPYWAGAAPINISAAGGGISGVIGIFVMSPVADFN